MARAYRVLLVGSVFGLVACAGSGLPPVIDVRDVRPAMGAPHIDRIRDAGTALVPKEGPIQGITDGTASPGELLVVEGNGFGRQPTVSVGGRPAEVLGRTRGAGLIVRVPRGVDTGTVDVEVSTSGGTARLGTTLRRLAVALAEAQLRFVAVGGDKLSVLASTLPVAGGRQVRVDSTGGAALVLADDPEGSRVVVVDLGRNEPAILGTLPVSHRGAALAVATLAPRIAVVGDGRVSIVDTTSLRRPVLFPAAALPKEVRAIRAAELSPDGRVLALLVAEGNRVIALDVSAPNAPQLISTVDLLPNERLSLVRDLAFSPDGQTLWVVSGASADTYPQVVPTRITAVRLLAAYTEGGAPANLETPAPQPASKGPVRRMLAVWKTQTITGAGAPLALAVGHPPEAAGSAIRTAPEAATIYVTALKDALLELGKTGKADPAHLKKLLGPPNPGMIARGELGSGGGPVATTKEVLGALALVPEARVAPANRRAVTLAVRAGEKLELGVATVSLDGQATVDFAALQPIEASVIHPPFLFGDLALQ